MSLSTTAIKIQILIHKFVGIPYYIEIRKNKLQISCKQFNENSITKTVWHTVKITLLLLAIPPVTIWRLSLLFKHWKSNRDLEQLCMCLALLCMFVIAWSALEMVEYHQTSIAYYMTMTQTFKLIHFDNNSLKKSNAWKKPTGVEIFVYLISINFVLSIILPLMALPIIRDYEPVEVVLTILIAHPGPPPLTIKILASAFYTVMAVPNSSIVLSVFLACATIGQAVIQLSQQLVGSISHNNFHGNRRRRNLGRWIRSRLTAITTFHDAMQKYKVLIIVSRIGSEISSEFFAILIGLGVQLASCCGYFTLFLYNHLPLPIYLACVFLAFFTFVIAFVLPTFGSIPYKNGLEFKKHVTRNMIISRRERLELRACHSVGFSVGWIPIVKATTALNITDSIINCTASLALMGEFRRIHC
ncbi:unnamed protein product [Orchesella dallaii]|uniref:Odorant receptor n=1 Tax=Orchesella dallaii TaxID=48710 RepID=A0ABP1R9P5_9HEXA